MGGSGCAYFKVLSEICLEGLAETKKKLLTQDPQDSRCSVRQKNQTSPE
jgi:hypothetical protein